MVHSITRRSVVSAGAALPFALRSLAASAQPGSGWLLLGTDKGEGIYRARWNSTTGDIGATELAIATFRPTFLARHPKLPMLYAANEGNGAQAQVSCFEFDPSTAELQLVNQKQTHGDGPCFVSVDATGQSLFSANYNGGSLTAFQLAGDGSIADTVGVFRYNQPMHGPVKDRQDAAHFHCATISPGNDFVLVCDLGDDLILVFPIAPDRNSYVGGPQRVPARAGSGPRHVAFHPNGKWVYCIHELDCTVDLYDWNVQAGRVEMTLRDGSVVPSIKPFSSTAGNTASELAVSSDGNFLYAATRGENTLTVFSIDPVSGLLQPVQHLPCGGQMPRYFGIDSTHRWLVCANQASSTLTVFARNRGSGKLTPRAKNFAANSPMCVQWL